MRSSYKKISHQIVDDKVIVKVEMSPFGRHDQPVRMVCTTEEILNWLKTNNVLIGPMISGHQLNNVNRKLCSGEFVFQVPPKQKKNKKVLDKASECVIMDREEVEVPVAVKAEASKKPKKRRKSTKSTKKTH